jgi:hypothetical protein
MPDTIGPHLLGRKKPPPEEVAKRAPYQMRDYLDGKLTTEPADTSWLERPISDLIGQTWKFFLQIWALLKQQKPGPQPPTPPTPEPPGPTPPTPTPPPDDTEPVDWHDAQQLDQGDTGHCVGFGCTQWENAEPVPNDLADQDGHDLYYLAKSIELGRKAVQGKDEDGTYVHDGAKALQQMGRIANYLWATKVEDITAWVRSQGPVVVGTDWYQQMFYPTAKTFLLKPTGGVAGGHCWMIVGHYPAGSKGVEGQTFSDDTFRMQNSWNTTWGSDGYAYITATNLAKLMADEGEAMTGLELPLAA